MDDYSRRAWIFLFKLKSDVIVVLRDFLKLILTQFGKTVKMVKSDKGTKFVNLECAKKSCVYTPQQRGGEEKIQIYFGIS